MQLLTDSIFYKTSESSPYTKCVGHMNKLEFKNKVKSIKLQSQENFSSRIHP